MKSKVKNVVRKYIERRVLDKNLIKSELTSDLQLILVVPAFKETFDDLMALCQSLADQESNINFELIIVLNNPISDKLAYEINESVWSQRNEFDQFSFPIHFIDKMNQPDSKKLGVGMARKVGMDQALIRFFENDIEGIIVCLDADCVVAPSYIQDVYNCFTDYPKKQALSIGFKHRISELEKLNERIAITDYELHLRYYIHIQEWVGLPFAFQTVGSAMAVRSNAYAAEGGMPILQAGEDFYFLHKFISKNNCENLPTALVFPSGRVSDRVPFGTGRAVGEMIKSSELYKTYNPKSFEALKKDLKLILNSYPTFENIDSSISDASISYFDTVSYQDKLKQFVDNTSNKKSFEKRFFQWFDAFLLMKYLHFLRDIHYPNLPLLEAVNIFENMKNSKARFTSSAEALKHYQKLDYPNEEQL